jgi:hypothetical protein
MRLLRRARGVNEKLRILCSPTKDFWRESLTNVVLGFFAGFFYTSEGSGERE